MELLAEFLKSSWQIEKPKRLTDVTSWHGHIPFAFAIVNMVLPKIFVELGVHKGDSYCSFCQAVKKAETDCKCYGVDTWKGDEHAGEYDESVFNGLKEYHDPEYGNFSTLIKKTFDEANSLFDDNSIDILHIDGLHTYEAVKHDFETWLPKMSSKGIVLFHDIHVYERDFGVWRFWEKIKEKYPSFEFYHSHGLGILFVGYEISEPLKAFFELSPENSLLIRSVFSHGGNRILNKETLSEKDKKRWIAILDKKEMVFDPESPDISVIIPVYNHEKYIRAAIYSALNQTYDNFELIIIDDGSKDDTKKIIEKIDDIRIRFFHQENQGAHKTINRGIRLAKGKYISILNSDDVYDKSRLEICFNILENDGSKQAVFSHVECIDGKGLFIRHIDGGRDNRIETNSEISFREEDCLILNLLAGNFLISTSNLFCRKQVFEKIGYFANLKYTHDYDFFLRLCHNFDVKVVEKYLLKYRIHSSNTIKESEAEVNYELGIVLSSFLASCDLSRFFPNQDMESLMARFYNSVNTYESGQMIAVLLLFAFKYGTDKEIFAKLLENPDNIFKKICTDHIQSRVYAWHNVQIESWKNAAEEYKKGNDWLKSQVESWKKTAEEYKKGNEWLKTQVENWKKAAEEYKKGNEWLKTQVQSWKKTAEKYENLLKEIEKENIIKRIKRVFKRKA